MKRADLRQLAEILQGLKIVLAEGCFDILHSGHVRSLESARRMGDKLVVAIKSDQSIRAAKSPGRPILNESERVALVSALRCVDHVIVFDEADLDHIIRTLHPAVHTKESEDVRDVVKEIEQKALGLAADRLDDAD